MIDDEPQPMEFAALRENGLGPNRFEYGVDGLRIVGAAKTQFFLPGDAFVKSVLGLDQLRRAIERMFPGDDFSTLKLFRFRSRSALRIVSRSGDRTQRAAGDRTQRTEQTVPVRWLPLYRGMPVLGTDVSASDLWERAAAALERVVRTQAADGRFEYYYDAKSNSFVNHEHPKRDPAKNPFYNFVRHCGGILTLLSYEVARKDERLRCAGLIDRNNFSRGGAERAEALQESQSLFSANPAPLGENQNDGQGCPSYGRSIVAGIECYLRTLGDYTTADGRPAAYSVDNKKGTLGGSGLGLYSLALYQAVFRDSRFADAAERLANHLVAEIQGSGEFRYYHSYLNRPVAIDRNEQLFSFYYPGEAIIGLAAYLKHVCPAAGCERSAESREPLGQAQWGKFQRIAERLHRALRFLIFERPQKYPQHFAPLPSDAWLMMGIQELWDFAEFQRPEYLQFVFGDADAMCDHQYTPKNALFPDYIGSFYYRYGDHAYPDGARAEGLTAAYLLAVRVDTTEQVASFFLKFLPQFIVHGIAARSSESRPCSSTVSSTTIP